MTKNHKQMTKQTTIVVIGALRAKGKTRWQVTVSEDLGQLRVYVRNFSKQEIKLLPAVYVFFSGLYNNLDKTRRYDI